LKSIGKLRIGSSIDSKILNYDNTNRLIDLCGFKNAFEWELIYRATRDGFGSNDFHRMCDNHSGTLIVIQSENGYIFGGFTSQLWNHTAGYKGYINEFLFSLTNPSEKGIRINGNPTMSTIYCHLNHGPVFGNSSYSLFICDNSNLNRTSFQKNRGCFNVAGLPEKYFTGLENFLVREMEVFTMEDKA
jgi:hypothetical protein